MIRLKIRQILSATLPYVMPVIAATLYIRLVLEAKYEEGWFDAQSCHRDVKCIFGGFDYIEFGVIGAIVIGSFAIVRLGRPKIGNGLAMAVVLLTAVLWIGMTR